VALLDAERPRRRGLLIEPASNPHLAQLFPAEDTLFWVTSGGCSCDLNLARPRLSLEATIELERERYRRKGWTEAKIARLVEMKYAAQFAKPRVNSPLDELHGLLERLCGVAGGVRLLGRWYSGAISAEVVVGRVGAPMELATLREAGLPESVVVELRA
jgi:hypothetical protein